MRIAVGFECFDEDHERENMGFSDRPKRTIEGEPLELTEAMYESNPKLMDHIVGQHGMILTLVSSEQYSKDVEPSDTFLVLEVTEGQIKPWFGYWDPTGCKFLRDRGSKFPYKWVTPTTVDPAGNVLTQGDPNSRIVVEKVSPEEMRSRLDKLGL